MQNSNTTETPSAQDQRGSLALDPRSAPSSYAMRAAEKLHPEYSLEWWMTVAHQSLQYQNLFCQACDKRESIARVIDAELAELHADKARLDWLEKARPIVWALEQEGCAPYWIVTDFDGKHEETPEFRTCRSAIDEALSLSAPNDQDEARAAQNTNHDKSH